MKKLFLILVLVFVLVAGWYLWEPKEEVAEGLSKISRENYKSTSIDKIVSFILKNEKNYEYMKILTNEFRITNYKYGEIIIKTEDIKEIDFISDKEVKITTKYIYNNQNEFISGILVSPKNNLEVFFGGEKNIFEINKIKKIENFPEDTQIDLKDKNFRVVIQKGKTEFFVKIDEKASSFGVLVPYITTNNYLKTAFENINKIEEIEPGKYMLQSLYGNYTGEIKNKQNEWITQSIAMELVHEIKPDNNIDSVDIESIERLEKKDWSYTHDIAEIEINNENILKCSILDEYFIFNLKGLGDFKFKNEFISQIINEKSEDDSLIINKNYNGEDVVYIGTLNNPNINIQFNKHDVVRVQSDYIENIMFEWREKGLIENPLVKVFLDETKVEFLAALNLVDIDFYCEGFLKPTKFNFKDEEMILIEFDSEKDNNDTLKFKYQPDKRGMVKTEIYPLKLYGTTDRTLDLNKIRIDKIEFPNYNVVAENHEEIPEDRYDAVHNHSTDIPEIKEEDGKEDEKTTMSSSSSVNEPQDIVAESFKLIESGFFKMGAGLEKEALSQERPQHTVEITYDFLCSVYETTNNEYLQFCEETKKDWPNKTADKRPVVNVTYYDAADYCNWLSKKEGLNPAYNSEYELITASGSVTHELCFVEGYRLPSEAEWEYAALGGHFDEVLYDYSGSDEIEEVAWYDGNAYCVKEVALKLPNSLELYDMSGNVSEWCIDYFDSTYYQSSPGKNPLNLKPSQYRIIRGGNYQSNRHVCKTFAREGYADNKKNEAIGFRVFRTKIE